MKYHHAIRQQIESDGFVISVQRHGKIHTVAAARAGITIRTFHNTRFMENPQSRNCNFSGNPLHAEQLEIVGMLGPVYAVNTCSDDK